MYAVAVGVGDVGKKNGYENGIIQVGTTRGERHAV